MISDSERRRLGEIEMKLRRDDPALVREFDHWRPEPRQRPILTILIVVALALTWIVGGTTAGIIALFGTGLIWAAAALWRSERGQHRGSG